MNAQFKNSNFGFIIYTFLITIIVAATLFMIWYMLIGYKVGTYAPDTRLGNVYIGGLSEEEVVPKIDQRIDYWYNDDTILYEIKFQDYSYTIDRKQILFDLQVSTYDIEPGITNDMLVYIQAVDQDVIKADLANAPYLQEVIDNVDLQKVINALLADAAYMKSYSVVNIEDFLTVPEQDIKVVSQNDFRIPEGVEIDELIEGINTINEEGKIVIKSKELFDIVIELNTELNDLELSVLASAMLGSILETNFLINEVNYEPTIDFGRFSIDNYPYYAKNSVINRLVDESLSFYNPNHSDYYFTIEKVDEFNGIIRLHGIPFASSINVEILKTNLPYITAFTTSPFLQQSGYDGAIIEVKRTITSITGVVISEEMILFEFYPPVKRIVFDPGA